MTAAQKKAKELFDKFSTICMDTEKGHQCALIVVESALSVLRNALIKIGHENNITNLETKILLSGLIDEQLKIKSEIENL